MTRTAFVIPWFGRDLLGGAEQHVFQVATRLARRGHRIDVLTTCSPSFGDDWQRNGLPEGVSEESGVTVRRFPVRPRNAAAFDAANQELLALNDRPKRLGTCPVSEASARAFVEENIHSPKLLGYLERESEGYQAVVFVPYLYGPTLLGVPRAQRRAVLQPLLHDETYAYLPQVEANVHAAKRILFISEGEATLAARLFGPSALRKGIVCGAGVEISQSGAPTSYATAFPQLRSGRYLLYLGRRDRTKNTDLLLRAFQQYRSRHSEARMQLVLAGPGDLGWPEPIPEGVVDAGVVSADEVRWLVDHCAALVQPSRNESYSRSIMEAWLRGRPVLVHGECLATRIAVEAARGGWTAATEVEWAERFLELEREPAPELEVIGERGRAYALEHADWDKAIDRYEEALELRSANARVHALPRRRGLRAIHQLLPNLAYGDAISNQATFIREVLRDLGHESEIFVQHLEDPMRELGRPFGPGVIERSDGLLYHHSIGTVLTPHAIAHRAPKALVYHNITTAHFFDPWEPSFATLLEAGRKDMHNLAPAFPVSCGDSAYNAAELGETGFAAPRVLPIFIDPLRWAQPADPEWMKTLQDGRTNVLFVGRVAPNKCQHDLVKAFDEYLSYDPEARLLLVGGWPDGAPYATYVRELAHSLGIDSQVHLVRRSSEAQLVACYRTAHLFWSMSEHEGFCVPLVEAMWFDVPVLAYRSSAVPETLGSAGLMFTEKKLPELAALAHLLVEDPELRKTVLAAQRIRRRDFLPEVVLPAFFELIRAMTGDASTVRAAS